MNNPSSKYSHTLKPLRAESKFLVKTLTKKFSLNTLRYKMTYIKQWLTNQIKSLKQKILKTKMEIILNIRKDKDQILFLTSNSLLLIMKLLVARMDIFWVGYSGLRWPIKKRKKVLCQYCTQALLIDKENLLE